MEKLRQNTSGRIGLSMGKERRMGVEQNVETIKAIYEAFGRGDVAVILDACTDDVDGASAGSRDGLRQPGFVLDD